VYSRLQLVRFSPILDYLLSCRRASPPHFSISITSHLLLAMFPNAHRAILPLLFYCGYLSIVWTILFSNLSSHYRRSDLTKIPWIILDYLPINSKNLLFPYLITCPIIPFKLLQGIFCVTFKVPYDFPYHCYLNKCSQIFLKEFGIYFIFSAVISFGLNQFPFLHHHDRPSVYFYSAILFLSLLSPHLLKLYYHSQLCRLLRIRTMDNLIDVLIADGVSCTEENSWSSEKIAKFRSEIGILHFLLSFFSLLFPDSLRIQRESSILASSRTNSKPLSEATGKALFPKLHLFMCAIAFLYSMSLNLWIDLVVDLLQAKHSIYFQILMLLLLSVNLPVSIDMIH
jgi:hypothetical protein